MSEITRTEYEVPQPIINSPFAEPAQHWYICQGEAPELRPGRRPAIVCPPREHSEGWDLGDGVLRATYDEGVWDHLAGTTSAAFEAGEHGQVAVKVIDDRGNELLVVKDFKEAE